ncbi:telomere-protecting terminal protein Tpg [Streptomyces sp. 1114.5]|uniref:telomere-protecting terminal protein Tpg n=1 Tax=Streptomyces sp. 1114.5 TaxID=1938830 RepID=UPI0037D9B876
MARPGVRQVTVPCHWTLRSDSQTGGHGCRSNFRAHRPRPGQGTPKPAAAKAIETKVRAAWQPRVRQRVRRAAEQCGFMIHISAMFGFSAANGSTDDPRPRVITQKMPGDVARRLYAARDSGASQDRQEAILAEALRDDYFKDGGRRARSVDVELSNIAWMDIKGLQGPTWAPCRRKHQSRPLRAAGTFSLCHLACEFPDEIRKDHKRSGSCAWRAGGGHRLSNCPRPSGVGGACRRCLHGVH